MAKNLLLSIIITNYNYDRFIHQAIDSALAQSYSNIEVIVVDDGSIDKSREIILSYGEKIIPVFKINGGQSSAFNAGFKISKGDVVLFLDADDVLYPHAAETFMQFFFPDLKYTKVQWQLEIVNEQGEKTGDMRPSGLPPSGNYREKVLEGGPTSCTSSPTSGNAWARDFLEKILPIPEDAVYYKKCADEYLYTLAPVFGEIKTLDEPLGFYRIHGKNIYSALSFSERLNFELKGHAEQTAVLAKVLRENVFIIDEEKWKHNSWFHYLVKAMADIESFIEKGTSFLLVDDNTWEAGEAFPNHRISRFMQHGNTLMGLPDNSEIAIKELLRLKDEGAKFIVFARQSFWWLDYYSDLKEYLVTHFVPVLKNDRLIIYKLKNNE